jgi:hypothetical protein
MMSATEEAERLRETALQRVKLGRRAKVPFADPAGCVTGRAQKLRQQFLGSRQSFAVIARVIERVVLVPETLLAAAGGPASVRVAVRQLTTSGARAYFVAVIHIRLYITFCLLGRLSGRNQVIHGVRKRLPPRYAMEIPFASGAVPGGHILPLAATASP